MTNRSAISRSIVILATLFICAIVAVHAAVIGIDFGSEFIKVALVKPGTPFHIVIDEQSMRKVPHCIGFDETQRVFGNGATSLAVRKPKHTYLFAHTLLGRDINSVQAKSFKDYSYPYELVATERNTVAFVHPSNGNDASPSLLTPEELVAMSFQHIKEICEEDAKTLEGVKIPVTDAVITVPEYWTQKERQALLDAAEIAGINVLSLVNENTAAAIQYGIDRKFVANETHRAIFYNMGSTSTKVSLAEFTSYPERGKKNKTVGQFEMLSVAYDETLGGQAFEVRILDHLVAEANKMFHSKGDKKMDVRTNQRAMAKLRVAAVKAKSVLSANKDTPIFVSSLANDIDFKTMLSRDKFVELSADLIERAVTPLKRVLDDRNFTHADIDALLIIGGGVRIPAIQSALKDFIRRDLGQGLDGDESMALGAVFRAANLSTQFQVRKFGMIDITPFPVGVRLANLPKDGVVEAVATDDESEAAAAATDDSDDEKEGDEAATSGDVAVAAAPVEKADKPFSKRAALFRHNNRLQKKKTVAFSHTRDLVCSMHHDSPKLLPGGVTSAIGIFNITGVEALIKDEANARLLESQKPKVALSFQLDGSGLVDLVKAEATLEEMIKVPVPKKVNKTAEAAAKAAKAAAAAAEGDATKTDGDATAPDAATEGDKKPEGDDTATAAATEEAAKTDEPAAAAAAEPEEPQFTTRKKIHRFNLAVTRGGASEGPRSCGRDDIKASRSKISKLNRADEIQREIAQSKNNVESHIYNTRQSLEKDEWLAVSTEAQREAVSAALEAAESWLYEQSDDSAKPFKDKIDELRALSDPIAFRVSEVHERAEALNHTHSLIEYTRDMLKRFATERPWLPTADIEELTKMVDEAEEWTTKKVAEQAEKLPSDVPAYTSTQMLDKLRPIARTSSALLKRKKPIETKPKVTPKKNKTATPDGTDAPAEDDTTASAEETVNTDGGAEETTSTTGEEDTTKPASGSSDDKDDL